MIKQIVKTHKTIHILINNNAGPKPGTFSDFTDKDFEEAHNKLILSVVRVNRLVLPLMKKQKFGRIINITSRTVKEPNPKLTLSSIYRVGVISLSKVLSKEYAKDNVFINSVAPGTFETERIDHLFKAWLKPGETIEEKKKEALAAIPSGKFGAPKELGNLVSFLASEQCTLTGTTIPIEGGISQVLW
jgi:3-oxoacyl-[acyl-carrier protein] reductase